MKANQVISNNIALTKQQREYFKNSKVRDENGVLIPVHHGSGTRITEFLPEYTGKGNDQYGSGFYFTTEKETAMGYTTARLKNDNNVEIEKLGGENEPGIITAYINLKNPLIIDGRKNANLSHIYLTEQQSYEILKCLPSLYYPLDPDQDQYNPISDYIESIWEDNPQSAKDFEPYIKEMARKYFSDTDMKTLDIMFTDHPTEFREAIKDVLGYDGVIVDFGESKHIIAWFPEQIKDVMNKAPEETPLLMDKSNDISTIENGYEDEDEDELEL